jgi:hypothetical protein
MGIKEIWEKVKENIDFGGSSDDPREDIPDDMTTDKYLRSLRRERRLQYEEMEKQQLKKDIEEYYKDKQRKYLWGLKDKATKQRKFIEFKKKQKQLDLLNNRINVLKNTRQKPANKMQTIRFFGRSRL